MASGGGVAWARVATALSHTNAKVVAIIIAWVVPHVLVGLVDVCNEDIIDAIGVEVAHGGAV